MGRLYYDLPKATSDDPLQPKAVSGKKQTKGYNYLEKVSRLIPAEVLAAYLTFFGLADIVKRPGQQVLANWLVWFVCLTATPLYLNKMADKGKPKKIHLIFSTLAFIAWSYAINGKNLQDSFSAGTYDPAFASIGVGLFSLIIGLIPLKV